MLNEDVVAALAAMNKGSHVLYLLCRRDELYGNPIADGVVKEIYKKTTPPKQEVDVPAAMGRIKLLQQSAAKCPRRFYLAGRNAEFAAAFLQKGDIGEAAGYLVNVAIFMDEHVHSEVSIENDGGQKITFSCLIDRSNNRKEFCGYVDGHESGRGLSPDELLARFSHLIPNYCTTILKQFFERNS